MNKEIREVKDGVVRITTCDERWYARPCLNPATGLPEYQFVPSVTWICSVGFPKGLGFMKWLASTGWDEAQAIKNAAGDKGSRVHQEIGNLLDGQTVPMTPTEDVAPLSLEEYECLMGFCDWHAETKPRMLAKEFLIWNPEDGYAGTGDYLCVIDAGPWRGVWLIDFKTGQYVWPEHEIQVSAYDRGLPAELRALFEGIMPLRLGILQIGYRKNKHRWKFTEVQPQFELFRAAQAIWRKETEGEKPKQKDYPLALSLNGVQG